MTGAREEISEFRNIGSKGLIIFERDGTLLKKGPWSRSLYLGDIDTQLIAVLKVLRTLDIRFGFISDQKGMDVEAYGKAESSALIGMLDGILKVYASWPDFWVTSPTRQPGEYHRPVEQAAQMNLDETFAQLALRYAVDKSDIVFVSGSAASMRVAQSLDVCSFQYIGLQGNERAENDQIKILEAFIQEFFG